MVETCFNLSTIFLQTFQFLKIMLSKYFCLIILAFILSISSVVTAQTPYDVEILKIRTKIQDVENLIVSNLDDIKKVEKSLSESEKIILWLKESEVFSKTDKKKEIDFFQQAYLSAKNLCNADSEKDINIQSLKIIAVSETLKFSLAKGTEKFTEALTSSLSNCISQNKESVKNNNIVAEILVDAALTVIDKDANQAANLGILSLESGISNNISILILKLRKKDKDLANKLLNQAILKTATYSNFFSFQTLAQSTFPEIFININQELPETPNNIKIAFLKTLFQKFQNDLKSDIDNSNKCSLSKIIISLSDNIKALLPQDFLVLPAFLEQCSSRMQYNSFNGQQLNTTEDFIAASEKTSNPDLSSSYLLNAMLLALQNGEYQNVFTIYEKLKNNDKFIDDNGDYINIILRDSAVGLAYKFYEEKSFAEMYKAINLPSEKDKAETELLLTNRIFDSDNPDYEVILNLLEDARKRIAKVSESNINLENLYLGLAERYSILAEKTKIVPVESLSILRDAVKTMNRNYFADSELKTTSENERNNQLFAPVQLPIYLLKSDSQEVSNIVTYIDSPIKRVKTKLFVIQFLLNQKEILSEELANKLKKK